MAKTLSLLKHQNDELVQEVEDFIEKHLKDPKFVALVQEYMAVKDSSLEDPAAEQFIAKMCLYAEEKVIDFSGEPFDSTKRKIVMDDDLLLREITIN
jgi:hypothetical protein